MWFHLVRISAPLSASLCGFHECWCNNYKLIHRNGFSEGCHGTVVAIVSVKIGWPVILWLPQCPLSCSQGQCIPAPCKILAPTGLKMSCCRETLSCLKESLSCSHVPNPCFLLMLLHRQSLSPEWYSLLRASSLTPSVSLLWNFSLGCPIQNASYLPAVRDFHSSYLSCRSPALCCVCHMCCVYHPGGTWFIMNCPVWY